MVSKLVKKCFTARLVAAFVVLVSQCSCKNDDKSDKVKICDNRNEKSEPMCTEKVKNLLEAMKIAKSIKKYPTTTIGKIKINLIDNLIDGIRKSPPEQMESAVCQAEMIFFTEWNEGKGAEVDRFWRKIKEKNLPFRKRDIFAEIMKKKKIETPYEYDIIIDGYPMFVEQGRATKEQLNKLITDYESKLTR